MASRKSLSKASRPSQAAYEAQKPGQSSTSSMSAIPDIDLPASITPKYEPVQRERLMLDEDEREAFLHDVSSFSVCPCVMENKRVLSASLELSC